MSRDKITANSRIRSRQVLMHALRRRMLQDVEDLHPLILDEWSNQHTSTTKRLATIEQSRSPPPHQLTNQLVNGEVISVEDGVIKARSGKSEDKHPPAFTSHGAVSLSQTRISSLSRPTPYSTPRSSNKAAEYSVKNNAYPCTRQNNDLANKNAYSSTDKTVAGSVPMKGIPNKNSSFVFNGEADVAHKKPDKNDQDQQKQISFVEVAALNQNRNNLPRIWRQGGIAPMLSTGQSHFNQSEVSYTGKPTFTTTHAKTSASDKNKQSIVLASPETAAATRSFISVTHEQHAVESNQNKSEIAEVSHKKTNENANEHLFRKYESDPLNMTAVDVNKLVAKNLILRHLKFLPTSNVDRRWVAGNVDDGVARHAVVRFKPASYRCTISPLTWSRATLHYQAAMSGDAITLREEVLAGKSENKNDKEVTERVVEELSVLSNHIALAKDFAAKHNDHQVAVKSDVQKQEFKEETIVNNHVILANSCYVHKSDDKLDHDVEESSRDADLNVNQGLDYNEQGSDLNRVSNEKYRRIPSRDEHDYDDTITDFFNTAKTIEEVEKQHEDVFMSNESEKLLDTNTVEETLNDTEKQGNCLTSDSEEDPTTDWESQDGGSNCTDSDKGFSDEDVIQVSSPLSSQTTKKERCSYAVPRFYYPNGKPRPRGEIRSSLARIRQVFNDIGKKKFSLKEMEQITKACGCPLYWKSAIFKASLKKGHTSVSRADVISTWKRVASSCHDDASRFVKLLAKPENSHLDFDDFLDLIQDIVTTHPGLVCLRNAPEFHTRYINTVIARIFYVVNRSWSGKITANELRRSNFLQVLSTLHKEESINEVTDYFSYEHFYVIYCKFWELDTDHDLLIDSMDLCRHGSGVLSPRLINRLFSGAVTRWDKSQRCRDKMSYVDFVWFLISEEDKKSPTSIEYWFRCMDLNGDGKISIYEMELFYQEQARKLQLFEIEPLPFEDCLCQVLDMVKPACSDYVTLKDLKNCEMAHVFFDTFINVEKYLDHEQKDPLMLQRDADVDTAKTSDWNEYAAEEYEILIAEEQANDDASDLSSDDNTDYIIRQELEKLGLCNWEIPHTDTCKDVEALKK